MKQKNNRKIYETKCLFFEINKTDKSQARLIRRKREKDTNC